MAIESRDKHSLRFTNVRLSYTMLTCFKLCFREREAISFLKLCLLRVWSIRGGVWANPRVTRIAADPLTF